MAETLLLCVVLLAGFVVLFVVDAHGKARAFEHGRIEPESSRPPEAFAGVELPPPNFNQKDPEPRESGTR